MSNIQSQFNVVHADSGLNLASAVVRSSSESAFTPIAITVTTADEVVDLGDVVTAKQVFIKMISGDPLLIGFDGATYPMRLVDAKEWMAVRLNVEGIVETSTVTTIAESGGNLANKYFVLTDVNGATWAVGFGTFTSGKTYEVEIATTITGFTAPQVAAALYAALIANTAFSALFTATYVAASSVVTITDKHTGTRTDIVDTGSTGFTLAVTQAGAASPVVHLKSLGTTNAVTAVAPN